MTETTWRYATAAVLIMTVVYALALAWAGIGSYLGWRRPLSVIDCGAGIVLMAVFVCTLRYMVQHLGRS